MANFYDRFAAAASQFPSRTAIELQTAGDLLVTSYSQLEAGAVAVAAWLDGQGIVPDDRVAILADNDARWIAAYFGALRLGAIVVPLDTAYKATQVRTVIENSGARLIFTTARYLDRVREGVNPWPAFPVCLLHGEAEGLHNFDTMTKQTAAPPPISTRGPDDAAVILYTSGTTADPKGVVLTHANLEAERLAAFSVVDVSERDAILGVLPLFHSLAQMANLLLPLGIGARVVFLETVSSSSLLQALQARGITILACVPQFFYLIHQRVMTEVGKAGPLKRVMFRTLKRANGWLRDHARINPGRRWFAKIHNVLGAQMRVLVTGGSKFDPKVGRDLYDLGFNLLNGYGLTETSGAATIIRPGDTFTSSVGQPLKDVEVRIAPPDAGADAREHEDGEVLIRGPIVMREYFKRPDATAEALKDGWLYTGDLGRLDAAGRLYITGRKKEMIVLASGKNLYPEEIEAHYRDAPSIKELCVLGFNRNNDAGGERLHAVIVPDEEALRSRGVVNVQQLIRFELESRSVHLPPHKRILTYDIWMEPLPRTTTGKIKRHQVEKQLRSQATATQSVEPASLTPEETAWLQTPAHADAIATIAARVEKPVRPDSNLDLDLALDSMERVELLTLIEQRHGRRVTPETRATIFTVRQLVDAVLAAAASTGGGADGAAGRAEARSAEAGDHSAQVWEAMLTQAPDPVLEAELGRPAFFRSLLFFVVLRALRPFLRVKPYGLAHIPADGAFILSPNHQSYLDPFVLMSAVPFRILKRSFAVGAAEYYQTPFMRKVARFTNVIPVDADSNLESAMKAGAAGLRLGKVLILFPEGERSIDGELKPFRKGASILSAHLNAPIVPVAMDGLFEIWPRSRSLQWQRLLPGRGLRVPLEFGAPVTCTRGKYAEGTAALRAAVDRMFVAMRRDGRTRP